jgi:uncharacterized protein involved in outer membrane biogenesis
MGMPKVVRWVLKALAILVVVLIVLVVAVALFIGPIIKTAAEKLGPKALGVPVTVEKVSVNAFTGHIGLRNLRVGNPEGYSADPAFALGELRVAVNMGSLLGKNAIEVKEVTILGPKVSYEVVKGTSNIDAMMKKIQEGAPQRTEEQPKEKKPARKVIIDRFECRDGEVSYRAGITLGQAVKVPLQPIVATDIGKQSGGTTVADAVAKMFGEIANGVGKAVIGIAGSVTDGAKAGVNAAGSAVKGVKDAGKGAVDKIKGLF